MKKLTLVLVTLFVVLALVGPAFGSISRADARRATTITYLASQDWIKQSELDLAAKFEDETGIHIDYQIIPSDQYFSVLQTKLNTGEAPDIFGGQSGKTDLAVNYDITKNGVDLSDEEWVARQDPLVTDQVTVDGKVYGMTLWDTSASWIIVYNKEIFADLGLSVPTTYEEFKAVCQAILDADIAPIYEPISDGWHHVLWFPELGPRYEEMTPGLADELNANEAIFADDATMLTALTQLKEMYDLGFFGEFAMADAYADGPEFMANGEYAMTVRQSAFVNIVETEFGVPASTFGFFVMPLADNQLLNVNPAGPSKFIYSGSEHIEEAKEYLRFLARPENLQYMIDNTPEFASLNFTGVTSKYSEEEQAFFDAYADKRGTVYQTAVNYLNPQWMEIGQDLSAMFIGDIEPIDVLQHIDERRADMAQAAQDPAWAE
ncbi:ABC transporter substrate-binding protein [Aggregatilinea lenta]|uniref:ABC transporter substrate-binding protein n=1 Tax=Aggregatilinea lenta TaxID=913108 RepID=UPI000E5C33AE|nr:ABC transporter substrate-binding protein [Aggregatilinea lenta]